MRSRGRSGDVSGRAPGTSQAVTRVLAWADASERPYVAEVLAAVPAGPTEQLLDACRQSALPEARVYRDLLVALRGRAAIPGVLALFRRDQAALQDTLRALSRVPNAQLVDWVRAHYHRETCSQMRTLLAAAVCGRATLASVQFQLLVAMDPTEAPDAREHCIEELGWTARYVDVPRLTEAVVWCLRHLLRETEPAVVLAACRAVGDLWDPRLEGAVAEVCGRAPDGDAWAAVRTAVADVLASAPEWPAFRDRERHESGHARVGGPT